MIYKTFFDTVILDLSAALFLFHDFVAAERKNGKLVVRCEFVEYVGAVFDK
jgi:hypothetical protein